MGATLAEGIGQVTHWSGVLIALADMPYVQASTFRAVADSLASDGICVPRHAGERGHPVGFGRLFFPALAGLEGDVGASKLLRQYARRITYLDVEDAGILRDIDRAEDLV
jgi:molybdenum cofactor cytidylyltransferase